jgi:murein tripeptide amidase MpaA
VNDLIKKITDEFPNITNLGEIGRSFEGNPIHVVEVSNYNTSSRNKKSVLLTGAHHSRELSSITMALYFLLRTVYSYSIGDKATKDLLESSSLYFIPIFNVDGFKYISDDFKKSKDLLYIRKNRNDGVKDGYTGCPQDEYRGVDLNRNYDFMFGLDNIGSSNQPCSEDFRGPWAFSEPETRAMRDFVESNKDFLKMAFNFHAYGNLLICPFNYDSSSENNHLYSEFSE